MTIHARIVDRLREDILSGALPDGTQLRQDHLADRYGASRIPVREALLQLEGEGLVEQKAHRGYTVVRLTLADIREEFDLRALVESDLIARAIPHQEPRDIEAAKAVLQSLEGTDESRSSAQAWGDLNWTFHRHLLRPAGRERTMRMLHNLHRSGARYVRMQMSLTDGAKAKADRDHQALLSACAQADIPEARRIMAEHILTARDDLVAFLSSRA